MNRSFAVGACLAIALTASASTAKPKVKRKGKTAQTAAPKAAAISKTTLSVPLPAGKTTGEVANTDIFKRTMSVRSSGAMRDFSVTDTAKITREVKGKPDEPLEFEAIQVGDAVDAVSPDGKSASNIRVRAR